jgi:hypothetical protein
MRNPILIGSMLPLANLGFATSVVNPIAQFGTNLTQPEAQVLSSLITICGSFGVALFMWFLNNNKNNPNKNREVVTYSRTSPTPQPTEIISDVKKEVNNL